MTNRVKTKPKYRVVARKEYRTIYEIVPNPVVEPLAWDSKCEKTANIICEALNAAYQKGQGNAKKA
jgi:hypothetical protein